MLFYYWRTNMQAQVWFLIAEPYKHSIIIIPFIGVSWHLKIISAFGGIMGYILYRSSDLHQPILYIFRTFSYIFFNVIF